MRYALRIPYIPLNQALTIDTTSSPLITYLAKAPSDITKWNPGNSAVWFKVHQDGYSNGAWASDRLLANKGIYTFTIPKSLKAGK